MSVANSNQWVANGPQYLFWAAKSGRYPYGTTGAITAGSAAGMGRLRGVKTMEIAEPDPVRTYQTGDNGVITSFLNQPAELPGGALTLGVFDQTFAAKANGGTIITALGEWDMAGGFPLCFNYSDLMFVVNSPMNSEESTSLDEAGWEVTLIMAANVQAKTVNAMSSATPRDAASTMNIKRSTYFPWGTAFTTATNGSTAFAYYTFASPYPCKLHTMIGNNSATTFTLDETPTAANGTALAIWKDGVALAYTTDYTVVTATKVVTMAVAPASLAVVIALYQFAPGC